MGIIVTMPVVTVRSTDAAYASEPDSPASASATCRRATVA